MNRWMFATFALVLSTSPVVGDRSAADQALRRGDRAEAVRIWSSQAALGNPDAHYRLARALEDGIGVPADPARAADHYRGAARAGHAGAQAALATLQYQGRGVARDRSEARRWAMAAAAQGNVDAAFLLGRLHGEGEDDAADPAEAFRWFLVAERRGHVTAAHERRRYGRLVPIEVRREIRAEIVRQIAY